MTSLATWALGAFLFWLLAARIADTTAMGQASALFSSLLALILLTGLGLPVTLARFSRREDDAEGLFTWAIITNVVTSTIGAVVFVALAPSSLTDPLTHHGVVPAVLLYGGIIAGTSASALADVRMMTLRRWRWVFVRVLAVNVVRIVLLLLASAEASALVLFVLAAGVPAASGAVAIAFLQLVGLGGRWSAPHSRSLRPAIRYTGVNYFGELAVNAPLLVLPVIVLLSVEPSVNATFYIAWSVAAIVFLVPQAIGQALLVEGGRDGSPLLHQARAAIGAGLVLTVLAAIGARVFDHAVVWAYGDSYEATARLLPSLVGASVAWVFTSIALAHARVRKASGSVLLVTGSFALTVLVPAALVTPTQGVDGAAQAWLLGNIATGVVAALVLARAVGWRALSTGVGRINAVPEPATVAFAPPPAGN